MNVLHETQVVRLWESLLESGFPLITDDGEAIKVVQPGRLNDGRGADLRDVVIETPRGREYGMIEFHVRASDWRRHGHDRDVSYGDVILHVVM
jgi:hypothetical protein